MAKGEVLRFRISKKEKSDAEEASKLCGDDGISVSELAREALNNRVKRILAKKDK